jgi:hypothetical protein
MAARTRANGELSPPRGDVADVKTRAGKGHEFGLKLSTHEKKALIAFLKTL